MVGRSVRAPTSSFRDVLVLRDSTSFPNKNLSRPPLLKAHPPLLLDLLRTSNIHHSKASL
jgi:hypothetical protein